MSRVLATYCEPGFVAIVRHCQLFPQRKGLECQTETTYIKIYYVQWIIRSHLVIACMIEKLHACSLPEGCDHTDQIKFRILETI